MIRRIAVRTRPPNPAWHGPLRAWLEQRARELRDEPAVRRVQVVEHTPRTAAHERTLRHGDPSWTLVIDVAHPQTAEPLVRDVMADLTTLNAQPELVELPQPA